MIKEMLLSDILDLPSIDSDGFGSADYLDDDVSEYYSLTVFDLMEQKTDELTYGGNSSAQEYDAIRESMNVEGINTIPIHVTYGQNLTPSYGMKCPDRYMHSLVMGNGHHRVALALELGHATMLVTDDLMESGW